MLRRFGTHPDIPDARDRIYLPVTARRPPRVVDLRSSFPPIYDQHDLNSCSANAIAAALWYEERRKGSPDAPSPSRLFIYYNERSKERVVHHNVPVSLRDGYKTVASRGVCPEHLWPYRVRHYAAKPTRHCYHVARNTRALTYYRLHRNLKTMQACLASGNPFTLGISVHESFLKKTRHTGEILIPTPKDRLLGGHAMLVVGYHADKGYFIVRNSFGPAWGIDGYCHLPFDFALHESLSWDFWTCERVGD